ncbi:MAG: hydroxymethylbilane synthase [Runella sp.]
MSSIRIGTRGSQLALWQAYHIEKLLRAGGLSTEIVIIETTGDQILDRSLSKIGSKGVFTKELEEQLLDRRIDIAVHSAKDLPSVLDPTLPILAFTEREQVNDVLVSFDKNLTLDPRPKTQDFNLTVGTSSTRRVAMLKHFYPQVQTTDMRGNLQTRLRKLKEGNCDALLLAYAGVHRMGYDDLIVAHLPTEKFTPAVGQGSVAVQCSTSLEENKKTVIKRLVNDHHTEICLLAERAFLKYLQGGCSVPVFGLATLEGNQIVLTGGVVSLDGRQFLRETLTAPINEAEKIGIALAEKLLQLGAQQILDEIKQNPIA